MSEETTGFGMGDVVKLKSGGPPMTIVMLRRDRKGAQCAWFEQGEYHCEWFMNECIVRYERKRRKQ